MRFYWLVLGVLGVWRITHFLHAEDGPWNLSAALRRWVGRGFWGALLDCFLCLSAWVAFPVALAIGETWKEILLLWPALSGGAILAERVTGGGDRAAPALYFEEPPKEGRSEDVVLRKESTDGHASPAGRGPGVAGNDGR